MPYTFHIYMKEDWIYYGTNAVHFPGSFIGNNLPAVVANDSFLEFKNKIKNIGDIDCGCHHGHVRDGMFF